MTTTTMRVVGPSDGHRVEFQGLGTRHIALGAPMHLHEREDEISHVLAGRLGVQIGQEVIEARPGDTVVKPRGVAHAFWNPADEPVRFLELITPAGFEAYFDDVAPILSATGAPDLAALAGVAARYALTVDPASMERLIVEHALACRPG